MRSILFVQFAEHLKSEGIQVFAVDVKIFHIYDNHIIYFFIKIQLYFVIIIKEYVILNSNVGLRIIDAQITWSTLDYYALVYTSTISPVMSARCS